MDCNYINRMGPALRAREDKAQRESYMSPRQEREERLASFRFRVRSEARRLRRMGDPVNASFELVSLIDKEGTRLGMDARDVEALVREAENALSIKDVG